MAKEQDSVFRGYIPELNALRAFGVVVVVVAHMWPVSPLWAPLRLSWILMDSFFVLSGFLIAGILLDSRDKPDYYSSFYVRRVLRIFPLYYLVITLATLALLLQPSNQVMGAWGHPTSFFFYLGNIHTGLTNVWPAKPLAPLWSLQIEEQFYLLFPLLIHRLKKPTLARVLWGLVFFSLAGRIVVYLLYPWNTSAQYVLLPLRMDGLALGALVAVRFRQGPWLLSRKRVTGWMLAWLAATVFVGIVGVSSDGPLVRTVGFFISSVACTYVVLWLILFRGSRFTGVLRSSPVQYVAQISYSLYLFHRMVQVALETGARAVGANYLINTFTGSALVCVLTFVASSLCWRYIESPLLRWNLNVSLQRATVPENNGRRIALQVAWHPKENARKAKPVQERAPQELIGSYS